MFMVFDPIPQRLRLKVSGEYTRYPVLCNGLLQAILVERNIGLAQFVWPHITDPPVIPAPPILEHPFLDLVHNNWGWQGYHPRGFRAYQDRHYQSPFDFDFDRIKTIWSTMMYPQARTVWYRVLTGKIPHNTLLFSFGLIPSPLCSFCHQQADNIDHFLVTCPKKWILWEHTLHLIYPDLEFPPSLLFDILYSLHVPGSILNIKSFDAIISTILWQIWNLSWKHGYQNPRPIHQTIINKYPRIIISKIHPLLLPSTHTDSL
jgi:hypothetical protein